MKLLVIAAAVAGMVGFMAVPGAALAEPNR
jgi:hypothetical protein